MRAFTQGTVDTFCAAYAVLNALQITHGIKAAAGRELLSPLLLTLAKDEAVFTRVLTLKTDYSVMIDAFLKLCSAKYPIKIIKPFENTKPTKDTFWETLENYIDADEHKTAVFQFEKRLATASNPLYAHWTTLWGVKNKELELLDSSPELHAVQKLYKDKILFNPTKDIDGEYICINPKTLRLIERV